MRRPAVAAGALCGLVACGGAISESDGDSDGSDGPLGADAGPLPSDCHDALDALGVVWSVAAARAGVADPVDVVPPIGGIAYRASGAGEPRTSFFMDCSLARALALGGPILAAHGVVEVTDYGVYSYRCIDQSVDPPCPGSKLSQHAYGNAIDIAVLTDGEGTTYSVNDDWVIDPDGEETCAAATEPGKDAFLHAVLCDLHAAGVFHIYLTPNYNAAHRNHWHVDLTPDGDFIEKPGAPGGGSAVRDE